MEATKWVQSSEQMRDVTNPDFTGIYYRYPPLACHANCPLSKIIPNELWNRICPRNRSTRQPENWTDSGSSIASEDGRLKKYYTSNKPPNSHPPLATVICKGARFLLSESVSRDCLVRTSGVNPSEAVSPSTSCCQPKRCPHASQSVTNGNPCLVFGMVSEAWERQDNTQHSTTPFACPFESTMGFSLVCKRASIYSKRLGTKLSSQLVYAETTSQIPVVHRHYLIDISLCITIAPSWFGTSPFSTTLFVCLRALKI